jgi:hypothetical protein
MREGSKWSRRGSVCQWSLICITSDGEQDSDQHNVIERSNTGQHQSDRPDPDIKVKRSIRIRIKLMPLMRIRNPEFAGVN